MTKEMLRPALDLSALFLGRARKIETAQPKG
jgi:hypothetical protein